MDLSNPLILIIFGIAAIGIVFFILRRSWGNFPSQTQTPPGSAFSVDSSGVALSKEHIAEVQAQLDRGNKIEAIKRVREITGMGLKEAKDFVERLPYTGVTYRLDSDALGQGSSTIAPDALAEVQALLARGNKIEAIKRVREITGMGLKEAKDFVETDPLPSLPPSTKPAVVAPQDLKSEVRALLAQGQKIQAVKRVREVTGQGLKEAKDFVDALEREG